MLVLQPFALENRSALTEGLLSLNYRRFKGQNLPILGDLAPLDRKCHLKAKKQLQRPASTTPPAPAPLTLNRPPSPGDPLPLACPLPQSVKDSDHRYILAQQKKFRSSERPFG
jgi:hypothetical protein